MLTSCDFVTLINGPTIPRPALELLIDLELRGITVELVGNRILARPKGVLTDSDRQNVARWRQHIVALLTYAVPKAVH